MPSKRRQKAKTRKSREMDMLSDFEKTDVVLGNNNINMILSFPKYNVRIFKVGHHVHLS